MSQATADYFRNAFKEAVADEKKDRWIDEVHHLISVETAVARYFRQWREGVEKRRQARVDSRAAMGARRGT